MQPFKTVFIILCFLGQELIAQPNFVLIVLDDMGWTGSSVQMDGSRTDSKSDFYLTPVLNQFALDGMTFSQGYAPSPKCSPSRCSIMTGKSTARNHFTNTSSNVTTGELLIEPSSDTTIPGADTTYAEWLKSIGMNYRTAHLGKWHLGRGTTANPGNNGFDVNDGTTSNGDGNQGGTVQTDPKKIFDLTNRSISFMQDAVNDNVPFLIQVSYYAVHSDIEARQETIDLYNNPAQRPMGSLHTGVEYAAMTEDTDTGIGQLLAGITNLGIDSNTYVIIVSDNGGQLNSTSNAPLSWGKTFITEGGIRVPFMIKGPNIAANSRSDEAIVAYDLFPTIAELTGSNAALPDNMDGQSIAPLLTGGSFTRNKPLFFHSPHYDQNPNKKPQSAVVDGNYKLVADYESGAINLYNLDSDIGESTNLSGSETVKANELTLVLRDHLKEVSASMPALDPSHANFSGTGNDVDADGLEDAWEFRELLTHAQGADSDPDNDGFTNLEEYNNGTDPLVADGDVEEDCNKNAIFANESSNAVCFEIEGNVRKVYTNNFPSHTYGPFGGNNDILAQDFEYSMCLYPELTTTVTQIIEDPNNQQCGGGITFGVSAQGINFSPFARIYFVNPNTQEENLNWHVEAEDLLNMDINGGHVNNLSRYHYHNIPSDFYTNDLNIDGSSHSPIVGYAADGFPIYYKYLYNDAEDSESGIAAFESGYALKSGNRPGDGITAPDGTYDGGYIEDYEYVENQSELDECGGRYGVTPEYPNGTYYYVLTDSWPYIPRCMKGKYIDNSFRIGLSCPDSTAGEDCSTEDLGTRPPEAGSFNMHFYPVPASDVIHVKFESDQDTSYIRGIHMYSAYGNMVFSADSFVPSIQLSHLKPGVYFVQVDTVNGQVTHKISIK